MDLRETIQYLRRTAGMPIRIIQDGVAIEFYGHQEFQPDPAACVVSQLWNSKELICYTITPEYGFYGMVRQEDKAPQEALLFGPATPFTCTKEQAQEILGRVGGKPSQVIPFLRWLSEILPCDELRFIDLLLLSYRLVNESVGERPVLIEYVQAKVEAAETSNPKVSIYDYISTAGISKEESMLLTNVQRGDVAEVRRAFSTFRNQHTGVPQISSDSLRNFKNVFIANVAFACIYAIRGGLPPGIALAVSDEYIRRVESLRNFSEVVGMFEQMYLDYTKRVAANAAPVSASLLVHKAYKSIGEHLYEKITPTLIADQLGVSVPHLCRKFKEETGKTIAQYINERKIDEAKRLLEESTLPLIQISLQLGFSSQNYFQYVFKKIMGITPTEFRENAH